MMAGTRIAAIMAPLLLLSACLLTPGKFTSTLDIRADRSFTFTYQGEVIATDPGESLPKSPKSGASDDDSDAPVDHNSAYYMDIAQRSKGKGTPKGDGKGDPQTGGASGDGDIDLIPDKDRDAKLTAIAAALAKEKGFRSAKYVGNNKMLVDYSITSRLDHSFIFPFNIDAQAIIPFLAIEVRADGKVRVQAPGFANGDKSGGIGGGMGGGMGGPGAPDAGKALDGTFTLTTNAEIVSQNQEEGATDTPRGKQVVWKVNSLTKTAPMATLRFPAAGK